MFEISDSDSCYDNFSEDKISLISEPIISPSMPLPGFKNTNEEEAKIIKIELYSQDKNQDLNNSQKTYKITNLNNTQSYKEPEYFNFDVYEKKHNENFQGKYNERVCINAEDFNENFAPEVKENLFSTEQDSKYKNQNQANNKECSEDLQNINDISNSINE